MNILFICTHNRCRSIICEAITNHLSNGRIKAFSAGSQPAGKVHPLSLKHLQQYGIATDLLKSESWDAYDKIRIDIAITVCDSAAGESCPLWMGKTIKVHWGLSDPSKVEGSEEEISEAFKALIKLVELRIHKLMQIDFDQMNNNELQAQLKKIAEQD